ncbi:Phosphoenolpyruvate carboxylase [Methanonatronarchaeum thermophilum]|uniref:Phosphoenolpyruvate carboxylase n=1 Tax=Methanonatronarchaeum thermophilum TaxID=1927129 RepID=A0A1Y3GDB8_9EURY|nr:phosphoenolpyruvate carboxylase [Methanonatronarchaeum thermophilum]OUJ19240.1 Phosphoenolpyruvate carboxylase [Methanonatronarchaeum thermophilum]
MKIPKTMVTQHPDSATKYTPIQDEAEEGLESLTSIEDGGLGSDEYMVDYEGKMTPYHQVSQVVMGIIQNTDLVPGEDVYITPRIPSASEETVFRQLMTLMSIMEANHQASQYQDNLPVFEVIHPMTKDANELLDVKKRFRFVSKLSKEEFNIPEDFNFYLIPLIEEVPELMSIGKILDEYIQGCERELDEQPERLRVMLGRSDPALSYGNLPAVFSAKIAISECNKLSDKLDLDVAPIYGAGALPFRGHIMPDNIESVMEEFAGAKTITIQSGIRYDIGYEETRKLIKKLQKDLSKQDPLRYDEQEMEEIKNYIGVFTKHYLRTFYQIIETVKSISDLMPSQRDRLARKGPVGYARDVPMPSDIAKLVSDQELQKELTEMQLNKLPELPRAISFTASLYTIGLPPEFIGTGRGLEEVGRRFGDDAIDKILNKYYPSIENDLKFAGRFVNLNFAQDFLPDRSVRMVDQDIKTLMDYIDFEIGPMNDQDEVYMDIMETLKPVLKEVYMDKPGLMSQETEEQLFKKGLERMGKIRGSLG